MTELEAHPDKTAVVIFARPYNGFAEEAHMGIPHKLASRGVMVLPFDFLDFDEEKTRPHMYWGMGQMILQAAEKVKKHPQLFRYVHHQFFLRTGLFHHRVFQDLHGPKTLFDP